MFAGYARDKVFRCPSNTYTAVPYSVGPHDAGVLPMVSYNTSRNFLLLGPVVNDRVIHSAWDPEDWPNGGVGLIYASAGHEGASPPDYYPSVERVGTPSGKVFLADGARYNTWDTEPDYDLTPDAGWGGAFCDVAPYTTYSRAWDRWAAPGASPAGTVQFAQRLGLDDCRMYSMRHGARVPFSRNFKMNIGFFDGHVETQADLDAANPQLWIPRGGKWTSRSTYLDVIDKYAGGAANADFEIY
jgi:prepilin-type processing-associated H-X9-DG protein